MIYTVVVRTDLSGKEPHGPVCMDGLVALWDLGILIITMLAPEWQEAWL